MSKFARIGLVITCGPETTMSEGRFRVLKVCLKVVEMVAHDCERRAMNKIKMLDVFMDLNFLIDDYNIANTFSKKQEMKKKKI